MHRAQVSFKLSCAGILGLIGPETSIRVVEQNTDANKEYYQVYPRGLSVCTQVDKGYHHGRPPGKRILGQQILANNGSSDSSLGLSPNPELWLPSLSSSAIHCHLFLLRSPNTLLP